MTSGEPLSDALERQVVRKVALRLLPLLCACFVAAFIDRVNVGFAKLRMMPELGISQAEYAFGAGIFFVGYFLFEVPSNLALVRFGARRWIARIMLVWGVVSGSMALVTGPRSFQALRFLLGAADSQRVHTVLEHPAADSQQVRRMGLDVVRSFEGIQDNFSLEFHHGFFE